MANWASPKHDVGIVFITTKLATNRDNRLLTRHNLAGSTVAQGIHTVDELTNSLFAQSHGASLPIELRVEQFHVQRWLQTDEPRAVRTRRQRIAGSDEGQRLETSPVTQFHLGSVADT